MPQNLETIYMKMDIGGRILPAEELMVVKDLAIRVAALEENLNGLEKPATTRRRPSKVSETKVSAD